MKLTKKQQVNRRHLRVRRKVSGTAERPRLYVRKSLRHVYVQLVDDSPEIGSKTLLTMSTAAKEAVGKQMRNRQGASDLGRKVGQELKSRGIETIVFDRGGSRYHGVVKALAEAVREADIKF